MPAGSVEVLMWSGGFAKAVPRKQRTIAPDVGWRHWLISRLLSPYLSIRAARRYLRQSFR